MLDFSSNNSTAARSMLEGAATFRRDSIAKLTFVILIYLDVVMTMGALSFGMSELNVLARMIFQNPIYVLALKVAPPPLIAWLLPGKLLVPSIAFMVFVIGWNTKELVIFMS
jgi:hypothetical protein